MKIVGVDLTPLQGPHRMRGVGSVVLNFVRHIPLDQRASCKFVFYLYDQDIADSLELAGVDHTFDYSCRIVTHNAKIYPSIKTLKGMLYSPIRLWSSLKLNIFGNDRLGKVDDLDILFQFEQDMLPPAPHKVPTIVIAYDLIPYILKNEYLWDYRIARLKHNYSRRGAFLAHIKRFRYLSVIRQTMRKSHKVVAISEHTKTDFMNIINVPADKIEVIYLGIANLTSSKQIPETIYRYISTSWGDIKIASSLPNQPFLLFVGGADPRRKLDDLIAAYNLLRAQGYDIGLVLAGDTMLGPNSVPNAAALKAISISSYRDDIYFLGFVSEHVRDWLYENALAFVYPSIYEGFGLPILEALSYGTPVITYKNSSIAEVGGDAVFYAREFQDISDVCAQLLSNPSMKKDIKKRGLQHVQRFSWNLTSEKLMYLADRVHASRK